MQLVGPWFTIGGRKLPLLSEFCCRDKLLLLKIIPNPPYRDADDLLLALVLAAKGFLRAADAFVFRGDDAFVLALVLVAKGFLRAPADFVLRAGVALAFVWLCFRRFLLCCCFSFCFRLCFQRLLLLL